MDLKSSFHHLKGSSVSGEASMLPPCWWKVYVSPDNAETRRPQTAQCSAFIPSSFALSLCFLLAPVWLKEESVEYEMIRDKKPGLHDIHKSWYNPNNFPPPYPLTSDPFFTPGQIGQGWNTSNDCNNRIPVVMCKTRFQVRKQETCDMCILCMWLDISMIILYLIYLFSLLPGMPQVDI